MATSLEKCEIVRKRSSYIRFSRFSGTCEPRHGRGARHSWRARAGAPPRLRRAGTRGGGSYHPVRVARSRARRSATAWGGRRREGRERGSRVHACGAGAARHWRAKEAAMLAATAQPGLRLEVCRDFMKVRATPPEPSRDPARGPGARPARRARRRRAGVPRGGFARSNRERPSENSTSRRPAPPSATPPARHRLTPAPPRDATRQGACYRDSCRYAHSTQDGMQPAAQVRTLPTPPRGRCRPRPREGNGAARTTASVRLGFERRSATRQNRSTR